MREEEILRLRECTILTESEWNEREDTSLPIGVDHANDGILTPDGFQWADRLNQWFSVSIWQGSQVLQIMSRARLVEALKFLGKTEPSIRGDSYGQDDIYYKGPTEPRILKSYELTWKDKTATFTTETPFNTLPKLEHRIPLPEMLYVENKPLLEDDYEPSLSNDSQRQVYYRVYPPPRYLFEEERMKATIHFSSLRSERVGYGHSAVVFRVRLEHPDITSEIVDKSQTTKECNAENQESCYPFERYSRQFYYALWESYRYNVMHHTEEKMHKINLDPDLPDDVYEARLRETGEYGIPWWVVQEKYEIATGKGRRKADADQARPMKGDSEATPHADFAVTPSENAPKDDKDTCPLQMFNDSPAIDQNGNASLEYRQWWEIAGDGIDPEPDSVVERTLRLQGALLSNVPINDDLRHAIDKMMAKPAQKATRRKPTKWKKVQLSCTVIAKLPYRTSDANKFIANEGERYNLMPDYLSESRTGFIQTKPIHQPQPYAAAIPMFYGMYVDKEGEPLLLLEECGTPIVPESLKYLEKCQLLSMLLRIHRFGMLQNSMNVRNIVVQPGPLTVSPSSRSMSVPSFRFIDFGQALYVPRLKPEKKKWLRMEEEELADHLMYGAWLPPKDYYR